MIEITMMLPFLVDDIRFFAIDFSIYDVPSPAKRKEGY